MHLIVGLGNPGKKYENNRHNVGFMAVDAIARRHNFPSFREKFSGLLADGTVDGERILLLAPQTFMNASGDSVGPAMKFYKLTPDDVTVIYDELDLAPGKVRMKTGGGHGGHNGIRSIEAHIGKDFHRVRLGIGHPGDKARVHAHVLGDFSKAEAPGRDAMIDAVADNAALLARKDANNFMNRVALATRPAIDQEPKATKAAPKAPPAPAKEKPSDDGPMAGMLKKFFGSKD
ncbi:aminoacyl-tRNA hydrolase [Cucumibacter marinus]|uniref:aminoacyl-tRNA hydrolase n=1 Tax=Cucumibacter marinus TaxID=1121252 RepID=UPI0003FB1305|nr:aminoacyl-tRNA hydrolase [Cucumibacter marinus]